MRQYALYGFVSPPSALTINETATRQYAVNTNTLNETITVSTGAAAPAGYYNLAILIPRWRIGWW